MFTCPQESLQYLPSSVYVSPGRRREIILTEEERFIFAFRHGYNPSASSQPNENGGVSANIYLLRTTGVPLGQGCGLHPKERQAQDRDGIFARDQKSGLDEKSNFPKGSAAVKVCVYGAACGGSRSDTRSPPSLLSATHAFALLVLLSLVSALEDQTLAHLQAQLQLSIGGQQSLLISSSFYGMEQLVSLSDSELLFLRLDGSRNPDVAFHVLMSARSEDEAKGGGQKQVSPFPPCNRRSALLFATLLRRALVEQGGGVKGKRGRKSGKLDGGFLHPLREAGRSQDDGNNGSDIAPQHRPLLLCPRGELFVYNHSNKVDMALKRALARGGGRGRSEKGRISLSAAVMQKRGRGRVSKAVRSRVGHGMAIVCICAIELLSSLVEETGGDDAVQSGGRWPLPPWSCLVVKPSLEDSTIPAVRIQLWTRGMSVSGRKSLCDALVSTIHHALLDFALETDALSLKPGAFWGEGRGGDRVEGVRNAPVANMESGSRLRVNSLTRAT